MENFHMIKIHGDSIYNSFLPDIVMNEGPRLPYFEPKIDQITIKNEKLTKKSLTIFMSVIVETS